MGDVCCCTNAGCCTKVRAKASCSCDEGCWAMDVPGGVRSLLCYMLRKHCSLQGPRRTKKIVVMVQEGLRSTDAPTAAAVTDLQFAPSQDQRRANLVGQLSSLQSEIFVCVFCEQAKHFLLFNEDFCVFLCYCRWVSTSNKYPPRGIY